MFSEQARDMPAPVLAQLDPSKAGGIGSLERVTTVNQLPLGRQEKRREKRRGE
jgi:hypothetical protein